MKPEVRPLTSFFICPTSGNVALRVLASFFFCFCSIPGISSWMFFADEAVKLLKNKHRGRMGSDTQRPANPEWS